MGTPGRTRKLLDARSLMVEFIPNLGGSTYARTSGVQRRLESSFVEATTTILETFDRTGGPKLTRWTRA
jgi:hypothetical protein